MYPSYRSCLTMPLKENGWNSKYSFADLTACFIQFAPAWEAP